MIKELLYETLAQEVRDELMLAFEGEFSRMVILPDRKFIGVHLREQDNLFVEEVAGCWSYGTILSEGGDMANQTTTNNPELQ